MNRRPILMENDECEPKSHSLRLPGEVLEEFKKRAHRAGLIAKILTEACLHNECVKTYIDDPELPLFSEDSIRTSPVVRVEFEQAIAFGGIGETLDATKSKSWGDGPYILPLNKDDWFYPQRITYIYRENSLYNRRFEQRQRMKEMLGRRRRKLVETAKYHTKKIFLENLNSEETKTIWRIFGIEPGIFWRAAKGKQFLELPKRLLQLEFEFPGEEEI